jgi:hypothetical protein
MDVRHFGLEFDKSVGPPCGDSDSGASSSKHQSDSSTEPRRRAGDERNSTSEVEKFCRGPDGF